MRCLVFILFVIASVSSSALYFQQQPQNEVSLSEQQPQTEAPFSKPKISTGHQQLQPKKHEEGEAKANIVALADHIGHVEANLIAVNNKALTVKNMALTLVGLVECLEAILEPKLEVELFMDHFGAGTSTADDFEELHLGTSVSSSLSLSLQALLLSCRH